MALATELNKGMGLSHGKTAAVLETAFGLHVSRGGLAQAFQRVTRKAQPSVARPGAAKLPGTVKEILHASLKLGDRRDRNQVGKQRLAIARSRLEARLDRVLKRNYRWPVNRRLANHLRRERDAMFTFLFCPGLEATNYRAEQANRPMVVTPKVWGGNRTERGAHSQSVLVSLL